jgi:hypothetical protein
MAYKAKKKWIFKWTVLRKKYKLRKTVETVEASPPEVLRPKALPKVSWPIRRIVLPDLF